MTEIFKEWHHDAIEEGIEEIEEGEYADACARYVFEKAVERGDCAYVYQSEGGK